MRIDSLVFRSMIAENQHIEVDPVIRPILPRIKLVF